MSYELHQILARAEGHGLARSFVVGRRSSPASRLRRRAEATSGTCTAGSASAALPVQCDAAPADLDLPAGAQWAAGVRGLRGRNRRRRWLALPNHLQVFGKGNKPALIALNPPTYQAIDQAPPAVRAARCCSTKHSGGCSDTTP